MPALLKIPDEYLPTPKLERYKYTNIPVYLKNNELVIGSADTSVVGNVEFVLDLSIDDDRLWVQKLLKQSPAGQDKYGDMMLWDLVNNSNFKGYVVDIPDGVKSGEAITFNFKGHADNAVTTRKIIKAGANSEFTIIEHHSGDGAYWNNSLTQFVVGKGANLKHYIFQKNSFDSLYTQNTYVQIEEGASYEVFTLTTGGKTSRNQIHVEMLGEHSKVFLNGVNLLGNNQLGDTTITVEHNAPNCISKQNYRSVVDGQAVGVFQGKIHVHQSAQKTDGYQFSKSLLLSPRATMNAKPELEIYADDVKCSHGATTGQLDDDAMFYMRSRGISEAQAKSLLIEAFIGELFEKITNENIREQVSKRVTDWLENHG